MFKKKKKYILSTVNLVGRSERYRKELFLCDFTHFSQLCSVFRIIDSKKKFGGRGLVLKNRKQGCQCKFRRAGNWIVLHMYATEL